MNFIKNKRTTHNNVYMAMAAIDLNPIQYFDQSGNLRLYSSL